MLHAARISTKDMLFPLPTDFGLKPFHFSGRAVLVDGTRVLVESVYWGRGERDLWPFALAQYIYWKISRASPARYSAMRLYIVTGLVTEEPGHKGTLIRFHDDVLVRISVRVRAE
ncbi:hypothetical protein AURDEDRAFT_174319 [Auricularia subglabra TFB-10046 SS5]|nr:hypothetical protein AURDEDRAFT_174319 [Auricularia subglabra TFB-10046 SS5]